MSVSLYFQMNVRRPYIAGDFIFIDGE